MRFHFCRTSFFRLLLILFTLGPASECAFAQVAPDPNTCVQKGGRLLCVLPLIGDWLYSYNRCNVPVPAGNDENIAIQIGMTAVYGAGSCLAANPPWGTPQMPSEGPCGSTVLYPFFQLGYEYLNTKNILVKAGCTGAIDGLTIYRERPVRCPDGYTAQFFSTPEVYCAPAKSTKCTTCDKATSDNLVGNPIDISSGNKKQVDTDYAQSGSLLSFVRTYSSVQDSASGTLGRKWSHNFDRRLFLVAANPDVVFSFRSDGTVYAHWKASGVWTRDADVNDTIAPILNGGGATIGWNLTLADNSVENYSATGALLSHTQSNGTAVTFTYSDTSTPVAVAPFAGLMIRATDSFGRTLN